MKYILLLMLVGCAVSMDELIREAKECVEQSANEFGVIGASKEQRIACWENVNKRGDLIERREKQREEEKAGRCPIGSTNVCTIRGISNKQCGCVYNSGIFRGVY